MSSIGNVIGDQGARILAVGLVIYLLAVGIASVFVVILNFPTLNEGALVFPQSSFSPFSWQVSADQGLLLLALFAGVAGSFLHAAQSLTSYIGNEAFKASWTAWYFLRPWVGGILGFALYFALRAGLVAGINSVNPYGVVALGLLGGWFSKTTTDKLQEVFETLFKTDEDAKRKNKLHSHDRPVIEAVEPSPVPSDATVLKVIGRHFLEGASVQINGVELSADNVSETELTVSLADLQEQRPSGAREVVVLVRNPKGSEPLSRQHKVSFE